MVHMNDNLQEWHGSFVSLRTPSWFLGARTFLRDFMFPGFEAPEQYLSPWAAKTQPQLLTEMNANTGNRALDHKVKSSNLIPLHQAGLDSAWKDN